MAISPNVDFTSGQILTATQQNQFPRGIVAYKQETAASGAIGAEAVQLISTTFTAVANRYYKITYFEPKLSASLNGNQCTQRIRLTNISGTVLQTSYMQPNTANFVMNICQVVTTFAAGSTVVVGTLQMGGTNVFAGRSATEIGLLVVEDIGPA